MSNTTKYKPFTFTTSFDELDKSDLQIADEEKKRAVSDEEERVRIEKEEAEAPPPPPTFSEEELAEAKKVAFEEGRNAGNTEAHQSLEQETLTALQTMTGHLAVLQDRQSLANESQAAALARIASGLVSKMMPRYALAHGMDEIKALVYNSLAPLESKGRINITIPTNLQSVLEEKITAVAHEAGFEGRIIYAPSENLGASDIKIDWGRGSAERNIAAALADMDSIIDQFLENHLNAGLEEDEEVEVEATIEKQQQPSPEPIISAEVIEEPIAEPLEEAPAEPTQTPVEEQLIPVDLENGEDQHLNAEIPEEPSE